MSAGFTLAQLQYFCIVAELGSFAAAADAQHVSSNAVASAVNALEESLGARLCVRRRSRGVELTPGGQVFYDQAKELLGLAEELHLSVVGDDSAPERPLAIGCEPTIAGSVLTELVDTMARRHPRAALELAVRPQDELLDGLHDGALDCALVYDIALPGELEKRELYRRAPHVLLSRRHRLASRKSLNLRELAQDPLILFDRNPARDQALRLLRECGFTPDVRYRVSDHETVRGLVMRNLGYAVTILGGVADKSDASRGIVRVPIAPKPTQEAIVVAWPYGAGADARTREFIDIATQHAARPRLRGR